MEILIILNLLEVLGKFSEMDSETETTKATKSDRRTDLFIDSFFC